MATPSIAPDPNVQTPEQIAEQLANQAVNPTPQNGEPQQLQREYVREIAGSVFRGKTQQELIDNMAKSIEHANPLIAEYNKLKNQPVAQPVTPQTEQYNPQKYYELWAQDPNQAEDYRFKSQFGVTQAEAFAAIQNANQFTNEVRPKTVIAEWQSNSDFPTSDPAEFEKAGGAMDAVWREMFPDGANVTPQNLEMVHSVALRRGLYRSEKELTQANPVQQFAGGAPPPPMLPTGMSSQPQTGQVDARNMKPEQIKALLEQMSGQR